MMLEPQNHAGLFDVIEAAIRIGGPTLNSPLLSDIPLTLGSISVALGPLASIALSAASIVAKHKPNVRSTSIDELLPEGTIQRAIIGEVAFGIFVEIGEDYLQESGFFQNMKDTVQSLAPIVSRLFPHLVGVLLEPALRISMEKSREKDFTSTNMSKASLQTTDMQYSSRPSRNDVRGSRRDSGVDPMMEKFIQALLQPSLDLQYHYGDFSTRNTSSSLETYIITGLRRSRPLLSNITQSLVQLNMTTPEVGTTTYGYSTSLMNALSGAFQRAVAGEAALQAMVKLPRADLEEQREMPDGSTQSWCDAMRKAIRELSPQVMTTAPGVVQAVESIFKPLLKSVPDVSQPIMSPSRPYTPRPVSSASRPAPNSSQCSPSRPVIRKKKSIRSISAGGIVPLDGEPAPPLPTYGMVNGL